MALMAWPTTDAGWRWYRSTDYRPYRAQRHGAADATVVAVSALNAVDATVSATTDGDAGR
jgi:uncharacterized protein (DUF1330 family)